MYSTRNYEERMRCEAVVPKVHGPTGCPDDAVYACKTTPWLAGNDRVYTCAAHRLPRSSCHVIYYVGSGSIAGKVVPIQAAQARRASAAAR